MSENTGFYEWYCTFFFELIWQAGGAGELAGITLGAAGGFLDIAGGAGRWRPGLWAGGVLGGAGGLAPDPPGPAMCMTSC
jgi:hypothetical protein